MILEYASMAFSNLRKRGIRSLLTLLGVFIGIAAVVSLISLGSGLQNAITGQFSSLDPDKLIFQNADTGFGPPGSTAIEKINSHDAEIIKRVNGVDAVVERQIRVVNVEFNDESSYHYASNIPIDEKAKDIIYDSLNIKVLQGKLISGNDQGKIILGNDFTDKNLFNKEIKIGSTLVIQGKPFKVVGILDKASTFQINSVILMTQQDLENVLNINDEIDMLIIQVEDQDNLGKVSKDIEEAIRKDRSLDPGEEDFSIQTPEQAVQTINTILLAIQIVISGIAAISLFVGGIGIANTMYTSVLERTKEIGTMKAVGARRKDILAVFLTESAVLGLVGGVIGAIIGLSLAFLVAFGVQSAFSGLNFSVAISYPLLSLSILFSLVVGVISGILPAIQASRLSPVEALRK